jgi:hypothetical protein
MNDSATSSYLIAWRLSEAITVHRCDPHAECEGFWIEVTAALRFELATGRQIKSFDI